MNSPNNRSALILLLATLLTGLGAPGSANAEQCISATSGARILPPSAGTLVMAAFQRAAPQVVMKDAQIICDHVLANVCTPGKSTDEAPSCVQVRLSDPQLPCKGVLTGPWCFQIVEGDLEEMPRAHLIAALGEDDVDSAWSGNRRPSGHSSLNTDSTDIESLAVPIVEATAAAFLLFTLFLGIRRFQRDPPPHRDLLTWLLILGFALALRAWLAPHSPGDLRFRLEHAFDLIGRGQAYTWGWTGVLHLFFRAIPASDTAVFWLNGMLAALTALPVGLVVHRLSRNMHAAWFAALAMALTPLHIRFSMTDTPFIGEIFFGTTALALALEWIRSPRWIHAMMTVLALSLAVQMRPLAVVWLLPIALILLSHARLVPWRSPTLWGAIMVFVGLLSVHLTDMMGSVDALDSYLSNPSDPSGPRLLFPVWLDPLYTPATLLLATAAAAVPGTMLIRHRLWILLCGVVFSGLINAMSPEGHHLANARYALRGLPFAAMLAGIGLAHLTQRLPRPAQWLAGALLVMGILPGAEIAERRTTLDHEYAFFVDQLDAVPDHCTILSLIDSQDLSLVPRTHLGITRGLSHTWMHLDSALDLKKLPRCLAYYRPASCWVNRPRCQAFEDNWTLEPLAETSVPAIPFAGEPFIQDPLPVGFYRLTPRTP